MQTKLRTSLLVGLVVLFTVGCLSAGNIAAQQRDVIVIGSTDAPAEISPANSYDYPTWHMFRQTTRGLVQLAPETAEVTGALAKDCEYSDDSTTLTWHLRDGVTFTDGAECDCEAIKWSLERAFRLDGPKGGVYVLNPGNIEEMVCEDDTTLRMELKRPDATFVSRYVNIPGFAFSPKSTPEDEFAKGRFAGVGPYKLVDYEPGVRAVYEAYEDFYGPQPKTKLVIERFYSTGSALRLALESGEIDVAYRTFNPSDIPDMEQDPNINVVKGGTSLSVRYNVFNVSLPPFDDKRVRQAISYAVDREALSEKVFGGMNAPLYTMVPKGLWSHKETYPKRDLEKARELLREAGYSEDNKLEITLWYTPKHYGPTEADAATVEAASIEETNMVDVEVKSQEWGAYLTSMSEQGTFGFFLLGWYPDFLDPDNFLAPFLTESPESNGTFFNKHPKYEELDEMLTEAKTTIGEEERTQYYEQAQELIADEVPLLPLWANTFQHVAAAKPNVKGVVLDASMNFRDWLIYKEE